MDQVLEYFKGAWFENSFGLLALLVVATLVTYPLAGLLSRKTRRNLGAGPEEGGELPWLGKSLMVGSLWPILATFFSGATLFFLRGKTWPLEWEDLSVFWLLALFQLINALLLTFFKRGLRRRQVRRLAVPAVLLLVVLDRLRVLGVLIEWLDHPFLTVKNTDVSFLSIFSALAISVGFFLLARVSGSMLAHRILPRLGMETALSDALGAICRYLLVLGGFFVAADSLGLNFTNLKILLGALSVGIGFGLQNIVNNFVSGLILMFERTVKRGDIVELGGVAGRVLSIGLRSSVVRTRAGHEIIVPNGELIAGRVDNLSFSDTRVRIDLPVGVSYSADPKQVQEILLGVAKSNFDVLDQPPPDVSFSGFGDSSLDFKIRAWIQDVWRMPSIKSDLYFSTWYALKDVGIEIPFPQLDLHLRSSQVPLFDSPGHQGPVQDMEDNPGP